MRALSPPYHPFSSPPWLKTNTPRLCRIEALASVAFSTDAKKLLSYCSSPGARNIKMPFFLATKRLGLTLKRDDLKRLDAIKSHRRRRRSGAPILSCVVHGKAIRTNVRNGFHQLPWTSQAVTRFNPQTAAQHGRDLQRHIASVT